MEGGNGVSVANGITQFAEGEQKRREVCIPNRRSRKPPLDVGKSSYLQLDGFAVKKKQRPFRSSAFALILAISINVVKNGNCVLTA